MSTSPTTRRVLPSQVTLRRIGAEDEDLIRVFLTAQRFAEVTRTGVFGQPDENGLVDITLDQFIAACVNGLCKSLVSIGPDGQPATLFYGVKSDPETMTGGCLNAPGVPGGRGMAAAGSALSIDDIFTDPEVSRIVIAVLGWNTNSVAMIQRLGFTAVDPAVLGPDVEVTDDESLFYLLKRSDWPGSAALERRLLALGTGTGQSVLSV